MGFDGDSIEKCGECRLVLGPGQSHRDLRSCVDALRHELTVAITCDSCGEEIGPHCVTCTAKKKLLNKAGEIGLGWWNGIQADMQGKKPKRKGE